MCDLISRESAVKIAERYSISKGTTIGKHSGTAEIIADEIKSLPSVDAVPLDILCEWLADYATPPANASNEKELTNHEIRALIWRHFWEKMMEE